MNFFQMQNLEYLFNKELEHIDKIVFKLDGELATANFLKYDENGFILKIYGNEFRKLYTRDYSYENETYGTFRTKYGYSYRKADWMENPLFSLITLSDFVKELDVIQNDSKHLLYNLHFLNSGKKYDFYLVDENYDFEVVSLTKVY